jgi:hypothetical protein
VSEVRASSSIWLTRDAIVRMEAAVTIGSEQISSSRKGDSDKRKG